MIELRAFQDGQPLFSVKTDLDISVRAEASATGPTSALYIGHTFVSVPVGAALFIREVDEAVGTSPIMPKARCLV